VVWYVIINGAEEPVASSFGVVISVLNMEEAGSSEAVINT
jgi:hypothetical protein